MLLRVGYRAAGECLKAIARLLARGAVGEVLGRGPRQGETDAE